MQKIAFLVIVNRSMVEDLGFRIKALGLGIIYMSFGLKV